MALKIGPFLLFRTKASDEEYRALAREAMNMIVPVPDLLSARGVRRSQLAPGDAQREERVIVQHHLTEMASMARRLREAGPPRKHARSYAALRAALKWYARALATYVEAGRAIEEADARRYRAANARGRNEDKQASAALDSLMEASNHAEAGLDVPPALRRLVANRQAYQRARGGALAFWE
jgi:hypothetical protein